MKKRAKVALLRSILGKETPRFPLAIQGVMIESCLFNKLTSFAWVACGLGTNCFSCPGSARSSPSFSRLVRFATGQSLGFLSSWPLFALCHHFVLWYCADKVYPSRVFRKYALLGDDIVIADPRVADVYQSVINALGVKISLPKSLISDIGGCEFAKCFRICDRDLICRPLV